MRSVMGLNGYPRAFGAGKLRDWRAETGLASTRKLVPGAGEPVSLEAVFTEESGSAATLAFGDIASFRIDFTRRLVELVWLHPKTDAATIEHLLDDHVAPRIIAHLGGLVIHGSAVEIAGRLAIFMGETGSGKSTLAASLLKRGHRLLGDDAVIISKAGEGWAGEAVYPSLRLFPGSISEVFAESVATAEMAFYSDKRLVRADALLDACPAVVPLGVIFILTDAEARVRHAKLRPADACMVMIENSFTLDPNNPIAAANRMATAAALASEVPCLELSFPHDFAILDDVCQQVTGLMQDPDVPLPEPRDGRREGR